MRVRIASYVQGGTNSISMRCPECRQVGTFDPLHNAADLHIPGPTNFWLGHRRCPNPTCHTHVFVVHDANSKVLKSYPSEKIDFDHTNVPLRISKSFEEALICHAESCYVAAAIMIRRTLEELCDDKGAPGGVLKDRITSLRTKVVLPSELFTAMDELRLLGNDAAHIQAKTYDSVGSDEIEVAIALTKEILKAVYQLDDLVRRLQLLKKPQA
jgi:Domain of unknown function (DUF4145)